MLAIAGQTYIYLYLDVSYSWPNGWTKWANFFEETLAYLVVNLGFKNFDIFFSLKNRFFSNKKINAQHRALQLVINKALCRICKVYMATT